MQKNRTYKFGDKGIWHCPASDDHKAQDLEVVVLEHHKMGCLYIFTMKPIRRGWDNLSYRTATIMPSDFTLKESKK